MNSAAESGVPPTSSVWRDVALNRLSLRQALGNGGVSMYEDERNAYDYELFRAERYWNGEFDDSNGVDDEYDPSDGEGRDYFDE